MGIIDKVFGTHSERELKRIKPIIDKIESYRPAMMEMPEEQLKGKTKEFKKRLEEGEALDSLLPEAYAVVREAARRTLGMEHYRVQLIGGVILHQGRIAEMKTGEGKTLVSTLPAYLNALTGQGVHIVVMKEGIVQQIGHPQEVYDDPCNLFVAKFLGTPSVNLLEGQLRAHSLYIGGESVLSVPDTEETREVCVGIRPEGFVLQAQGALHCELCSVEVMGRDNSVVSAHPASLMPKLRSIISAEQKVETKNPVVSFDLKPSKTYLFDKETEKRIPIKLQTRSQV